MIQKVIVVEANEIPLKLFKYYQSIKLNSSISYLLENSLVLETLAQDVDESFLYPSQTWASCNTGSPYALHKIHWYNDPKPQEFPLYWKVLAENAFKVGLVNTLHSSPASSYAENDSYKFVIPDSFAVDAFTKPSYYQTFQQLNLKATSQNSRVSTLKAPLQELLATILNLPRYGIGLKTIFDAVSLVSKILLKQVNKERLRNLQFPLIADMFMHQLQKHKPDLAILFTNHVAANMHRYWYALFPNDYPLKAYEQEWVNKYSNEIIESLDILDYYLHQLIEFTQNTNSILVIVSSMGQHANITLPEGVQKLSSHDFRLEDARKLVDKLTTSSFQYKVEAGMVPQYSLEFSSSQDAEKCFSEIQDCSKFLENINLKVDLNRNIITLTTYLEHNATLYGVKGQHFTYSQLGFVKFNIEDHHSGCHYPKGSLIIFNSKTSSANSTTINYLEYAPAILNYFGVQRPEYMIEPSFKL
ncbi:hypothetical protein H6G41_01840 [Tolypothrix sp. FACHB-123]|uniref:hypothetical protein n=1 Tax=Tolypothrix sp. FACHB-123 TaxID=2692868 RepID=UPI001689C4F7|nr:hypothetical protein [Tolypothrix sp. FACHB-123]MBD2353374.1 hypothetical protein [Tolypothrix sp. FACHB-123]